MKQIIKSHGEIVDNSIKEKEIEEVKKLDNSDNEKFKFEDFTPKDDLEIEGALKDAFDYAFNLNNIKVKNIGLLGKYSSGKSSLINSYLKRANIKYIKISFAFFREFEEHKKNNDKNSNENNENINKNKENSDKEDSTKKNNSKPIVNENILEIKIINQLVNLIDSKYIKLTSFYIKREYKDIGSIFQSIFMALYVIFLICLTILIKKIDKVEDLFKKINILIVIIIVLFILGMTAYCIHKLIIVIINGKKIKFSKLELELNKDSEQIKSYFDTYLTEIIYLLEKSKCNIILFEDIDRFEIKSIFQRLHEVNGVVNQRLEKKNKCIKFVYLAKEDIFTKEDRVKFCDFIIPTPFIINQSNSYNKLMKLIENNNRKFDFNHDFLKDICKHITDIRVLKSIFNEFLIYYDELYKNHKNTDFKINANKVFSIVLYKSFCPKDFNDLQENKGILYGLLFDDNSEKIADILHEYKLRIDSDFENNLKEMSLDVNFDIENYFKFFTIMYIYFFNDEISNLINSKIDESKDNIIPRNIRNMITKYIFKTTDYMSLIRKYNDFGILRNLLRVLNFNIFYIKIYIDMIINHFEIYKNFSYFNFYNLLSIIFKIYNEYNTDVLKDFFYECMIKLLDSKNINIEDNELWKSKELVTILLSRGYLDNEILFYTTMNDLEILKEQQIINKIRNSLCELENFEFYIENFSTEIDPKKLVTNIDLIYWYDNLNILNFNLLNYLLNYSSEYEYDNNNNKQRLDAFFSNLIYRFNFILLNNEAQNKIKFLFCCKYYCINYIDFILISKFIGCLKFRNVKFYKMYLEDKYFDDNDKEKIKNFLIDAVNNNMYIINKHNMEFIGKNIFNNNINYFKSNYSFLKKSSDSQAIFEYINSSTTNLIFYMSAIKEISEEMDEKIYFDNEDDVIFLFNNLFKKYICLIKKKHWLCKFT